MTISAVFIYHPYGPCGGILQRKGAKSSFRIGVCIRIVRNQAIPTRFLPQRNAKNAEIRAYVLFFAIFAIFCGNSFLVAALPRCSAIPKNCAFLAKFFLLFVSFVASVKFFWLRLCRARSLRLCDEMPFLSVKSVKSVVQFLCLRLATLGSFAAVPIVL